MFWLLILSTPLAVAALLISGKYIIRSGSVIARSLHVSEYVLSFILIALATSLPELSVGINSALVGVPELSFGDIIGTNIVNLTLVVGLVTVVSGTLTLRDYTHFKNNRLFELAVLVSPLILLLDGTLSRLDGGILLVLFAWNIIRLLDIDDKILGRKVLRPHYAQHAHEPAVSGRWLLYHVAILLVAVASLLTATHILVQGAQALGHVLEIPEVLVGVLIIATLTSLPELTVGIRGALAGRGGLALGDEFGSSAINATLVLGIVALIEPIHIADTQIIITGLAFTVMATVLLFIFLHTKHSLSRWEGMVLCGCYVLFIGAQFL